MLRNVLVNNLDEPDLGQTVLAMDEPSASVSYFIKEIKGLGPTDAAISTAPFAAGDDTYFVSGRRGGRNVVLTLGYDPNYLVNQTITSLKHKLYSIFPPGERVRLWFDDDELPDMVVFGYVDKVEPVPFAADPTFQVSVVVPLADMVAPASTTMNVTDRVSPKFKYDGTAPTPIEITATIAAACTDISVQDQAGNYLLVQTTAGFAVGDTFYMNTERGKKTVYRTRSGTRTYLFDTMAGNGDSLEHVLKPRNTALTIRTNASTTGKNVFAVKYVKRYLGV